LIGLISQPHPKNLSLLEKSMRNVLLFLGLSLYATMATAQLREGLLPIDEAYKVSADIQAPGVVTVHFVIAPDYYLYRGQMKFIAGKDTTLGEPKLPDGKQYQDPYLGEVETYHQSVDATIPYMAPAGAKSIHLIVGYQGCHEVKPKLCYPPHTKAIDVALSGTVAPAGMLVQQTAANAAESTQATGAARYAGSPATRALLKSAKTARDSGDMATAFTDYKKAVSMDPDFANAQFEYLMAARSMNTLNLMYSKSPPANQKEAMAKTKKQDDIVGEKLIGEYEALAAQHPHDAIYPWSLGLLYNETDLARQESYCRQAVKLDKNFAQGYMCLGQIAGVRGQDKQAVAYMRHAAELAPDDEEIASGYGYQLGVDGSAHDAEIKALLQRFPDSMAIAYTLVNQANALSPKQARIAALERLRKDAPGASNPVASAAAEDLFPIYMASDLSKAKSLAADMSASKKEDKTASAMAKYMSTLWVGRVTYVDGLIKARHELDTGHAQAALASLKAVESQKDQGSDKSWYLLQAQALDAAGRTADAVAMLRDSFVAEPNDAVQKAMFAYGTKLGKTEAQIGSDLWVAFQAKAKPATPFTLARLDNSKPLSLSDYRGKVVIVDFWYPNCGPCHAAFPFLQKVAAKFKDKGLTVLAITSIKAQQPFALPFLRAKGYDFIGLAGSEEFAEKAYGVDSYPSTFLIGADGKTYMVPTLYDDAHELSTEAAVRLLLQHAKS